MDISQHGSNLHEMTVTERVSRVINRIRPAVQADGGDVELIEVSKAG
ncbi:MAG: Fe-S cluster biogenesis protein NfuA, partial [Phycisphaerales bacterium]